MASQSKAQKKTVERVMHEFKHGELKSSAGPKVKNPKQAVAIALNEAGASRFESPAANKATLRKTKAKERLGATGRDDAEGGGPAKAELYAQARERNIPGRSRMDKAELQQALRG